MNGSDVLQELIDVGKYMVAHDLAWGNSGNISARTANERFYITASGTYLGELSRDDFVEYNYASHEVIEGNRKPSKEIPMHEAIYRCRPEVRAILHASPLYSTMWACTKEDVPNNWFVEDFYYLERVSRVPYCHPGSQALGNAVLEKAMSANILLLENHGVLVYDTSISEARMALHTLETVCKMAAMSKMAGITMEGVSETSVTDFLLNSGYRPARGWHSEDRNRSG